MQQYRSKFEIELSNLKPQDTIQITSYPSHASGYPFISTAGHGYLVVPTDDPNYPKASAILSASGYGFKGIHAIYLEEDIEAGNFLRAIPPLSTHN